MKNETQKKLCIKKTDKELLELYKEEIKNGEVKKEDLLLLKEILERDINPLRTSESTKEFMKTGDLFEYFSKYTCFNWLFYYRDLDWNINSLDLEEGKEAWSKYKKWLQIILFSNAYKSIDL